MLPVQQVITDEVEDEKASEVFNAQWYPDVTAYVKQTGTDLALSVKLQGSLNNSDWVDIGNPITSDGILVNHDGTKRVYFPYYRLYITTNTGTEGFKLNAWMGCGGA